MGKIHINDLLLDPDFQVKECVKKVSEIVIKKSGPNNKRKLFVTENDIFRRNEYLKFLD